MKVIYKGSPLKKNQYVWEAGPVGGRAHQARENAEESQQGTTNSGGQITFLGGVLTAHRSGEGEQCVVVATRGTSDFWHRRVALRLCRALNVPNRLLQMS